MGFLDEIIELIDISIKEDAENLITMGNIIKDGYNEAIDTDRNTISDAHSWVTSYQANLIEETGITNLKIKFTNNSGYFIEVSKIHQARVPDFFIQTQTLTQAARYKTSQLENFEKKLLSAQQDMSKKEYDCFLNIRSIILEQFNNLYDLSRKVARIDFYANGAHISLQNLYVCPDISQKYGTSIIGGKHPVVSHIEDDFISNDMTLGKKDFVHIITGPNMGGKSTYLRQNALLILMAHMGYDIPCKKANIGLTDKIFSRVGAGDNIYLGQSTFMVEMQEISFILRNSTKNSFVIIDEIGRGTSTYDGMSLAWAILQYNHNRVGAKTLFATHYHEIIDHAEALSGVSNYSVAVGENDENIVFLRKIIPGGIKKSYGIEVAKIAGIPHGVLSEAQKMLKNLQSETEFMQLSLRCENDVSEPDTFQYKDLFHEVSKILLELDINNIPPIKSLEILASLQKKVENLEKNLNNKK